MLYSHPMDDLQQRLEPTVIRWGQRLQRYGLAQLLAGLLEVGEPLSMVGAQALYVAQPVLALMTPSEQIQDWARLLETPGGLAWFRQQLTTEQAKHDE